MSKPAVDMGATKQALATLDRIARENPHMIDHGHAKWTDKDIAAMIAEQVKTTYTVEEVAELLNCHPQTIRRAIRKGNLKAAKIGRSLSISRLDLEAYYQAKGGGRLFTDAIVVPEAE